jgi:glycosyltransferase involved in cell wall biosynthesis
MADLSLEIGWICLAAYQPDVQLLATQIDSISKQTVTTWRCEIGIDGQDSNTREAVEELVAGDSRFRVHEFPANVGFYRNFERLLARVPADADWVALSDQDDEWFPQKLELHIPLLKDASLAFGQAFVVDIERPGEKPALAVRRPAGLIAALIDNQVTGSMAVFHRGLVDIAVPFPASTDSAFHDHWLGLCALVADGIGVTAEPLQNYVQHGANVIGEEQRSGLGSRLRRLAKVANKDQSMGVDYISEHRWGWRVSMARTLIERMPDCRTADRKALSTVADDHLSPRLLRMFALEVLRGRAPALRAVALLVGAARSPRTRARRVTL